MFESPLYWIADPDLVGERSLVDLCEEAIAAGLRVVQYRDKHRTQRERYHQALALARTARRAKATLIINDNLDLTMAVEADGVHVGQDDFPVADARRVLGGRAIIGCSAHTVDQAKAAEAEGADYLGVGPVFASTTKMARPPLGLSGLRDVCRSVRIPVYAIGGITPERCPEVLGAGAKGVAVASALLSGPIGARTRAFFTALRPSA